MSNSSRQNPNTKNRWFFTKEQISDTPSKRDGIERYDELRYRQNAANLIQDCGKKLNVPQLTINTAIVFMHRFFMLHSFKKYDKYDIAAASLFLAAKVEEQPRKVEHVLKTREEWSKNGPVELDIQSEDYQRKLNKLVDHELIMLQTFGFDISIDHPHKHVIRATQFMRAPRELSQVAYFMATNSLYLTTLCLEMRSEIVAATCIYLAFKWSEFEVGLSTDGREWWSYLDQNLTEETLIDNVKTYVKILQEHPARMADMKKHCENSRPLHRGPSSQSSSSSLRQPSSNNQGKRPKPVDMDVQDSKHKRPKTDDKKPDLPPIRPPNTSHSRPNIDNSNQRDRKSAPGGLLTQPEIRSTKPSVNNSQDSRTSSYMPLLRKDVDFVKKCLRDREFWCKLSDEEKEYCKRAKEKMKKKREQDRNDRVGKDHKKNRQKDQLRGPPPPSETQAATDSLIAEIQP